MSEEDIACPFCGSEGLDKIGLKNHLVFLGCDEFDNTISIAEERAAYDSEGDDDET